MDHFWGKLIGFFLGLSIAGFIGGIVGFFIGHYFDSALAKHINPQQRAKVESSFFKTTFQVMGAIAKADGHVTERTLAAARSIINQYPSERRAIAIQLFNEGKQADFNFSEALTDFMRDCHHQRAILRTFLDIQVRIAYADGPLSAQKRQLIQTICLTLQFGQPNFLMWDLLYGQLFGGGGFQYQQQYQQYQSQGGQQNTYSSLAESYAVLEVSPSISDADLKKAYRKLVNQHHPDKLAANGLPPEMQKEATQKMQQIQQAYDRIKKSRGIT